MKVTEGFVLDHDLPALDADGRGRAMELSRECPDCGGAGLVVIDAADERSRHRTASATCCCVHGRWINAWHAVNGRETLRRLPTLRDVKAQRVRGWRHSADTIGTRATEEAPAAPTRDDINAMFRRPA